MIYFQLKNLTLKEKSALTAKKSGYYLVNWVQQHCQQCVVTLEAVKCRIDEKIKRIYIPVEEIPSLEKDDGRDVELELDENLEPLTNSLDLSTIALEALALALPDYPRSNNAEYVTRSIGIDDQIAAEENSQNPFAILNTLKEKLKS